MKASRELPESGGHIESRECWCSPRLVQSCPECEGQEGKDCWRCGGEKSVDMYDEDEPAVIVHTEARLTS